jgi:hypothetical protein
MLDCQLNALVSSASTITERLARLMPRKEVEMTELVPTVAFPAKIL